MSGSWIVEGVDEARLTRLAELIALKVRAGDLITLTGDLGAGKTTFARALIRAMLGDPEAEVPSPTFTIVQPYATARIDIAHCDLYRLADPAELDEIGFDEAVTGGLALVEWPERAEGR
ncbi:MAG: tRNA (adenosine(37)-N6)-threonylcarbamoyltransferase complex ATPase subunit type 1 TsaE, partial [Hyphomicrobium sp.]|nr:tRNA (adenosine(37)-N6)-threonylcarbamoyltransferase complex ATPase subunit type 1 TsaE [Hyphomicrobium sp.]